MVAFLSLKQAKIEGEFGAHEEPELWSTSKPFAKLGKGMPKLSVVRWRETEHFARQNHQIRKVCQNSQGVTNFGKVSQNFVGCAKLWQGVPNFRRVYENHYVRTDLQEKSPEL